jgi:hypothetical protein
LLQGKVFVNAGIKVYVLHTITIGDYLFKVIHVQFLFPLLALLDASILQNISAIASKIFENIFVFFGTPFARTPPNGGCRPVGRVVSPLFSTTYGFSLAG